MTRFKVNTGPSPYEPSDHEPPWEDIGQSIEHRNELREMAGLPPLRLPREQRARIAEKAQRAAKPKRGGR